MSSTTQHRDSTLAISVKDLSKSYGKVQALRGINLSVERGEIYGFLGPNGAGKTTTIRCMLDSIRPNGGTIQIMGVNPQSDPVTAQAMIGYLPGEVQFFANFTAERQLRFFNDMRGSHADWAFAHQLAERLSLDLSKQVKNLSKGNKQKIAVIQALMHHPALLILDEPTSGLDPLMQKEVLDLLREANAGGATVFFSSHIMSEIESVASRVAIIRAGKIIEVSDTDALTHHSINNLSITFKRPVDMAQFKAIAGVTILSTDSGIRLTMQVTGDMEALVQVLGQLPVLDLETSRPTLEDIFLTYYATPVGEA